MDKEELIPRLKDLISKILEPQGLELVDLIYRHEGRDMVLRVLVDRPEGGVSVGECSLLNAEISSIMDEQDFIAGSYLLEVSSPGIDRPLKSKADFLRCLNRVIKIFLTEAVNGKIEWDGKIVKVEGETLFLEVKGEVLQIPLNKVNKAKQLIV